MPIYDYRCGTCDTTFEELVEGSSESWQRVRCPKCAGEASRDRNGETSASLLRVGGTFVPEFVDEEPAMIDQESSSNAAASSTLHRSVAEAGASGMSYLDEAAVEAVDQLAERLKQEMAPSLAPLVSAASQLPSVLEALRRIEERLQRIESELAGLGSSSPISHQNVGAQEGNAG